DRIAGSIRVLRMRGEEVGRLEILLAFVDERATVEIVRTTLRHDRDRTAGRFAGICAKLVGVDDEFLNALSRIVLQEATDDVVFVVTTIDAQIEIASSGSVDRDRADTGLRRIERADRTNAGRQDRQGSKRTSVQRQIRDLLLVDVRLQIRL